MTDKNPAAGSPGSSFGESRAFLQSGGLLLRQGDWEGALEQNLRARRAAPQFANSTVGACYWIGGRREAACEDWSAEIKRRRDRTVRFMDAAGGIIAPALLWWASAYEDLRQWRKPAIAELKGRWKTKWTRERGWPGPIAGFLLDEIPEKDFLFAGVATRLSHRDGCQAHFYVGVKALSAGRIDEYRASLERAVEISVDSPGFEPEYYLCRYELHQWAKSGDSHKGLE